VRAGLKQIRHSFEHAGGVRRAADAMQAFKKRRQLIYSARVYN
jgi:hypothetical protein